MKLTIKDNRPFNGAYYTPDEYKNMRLGMFEQKPYSMFDISKMEHVEIPKRYFIVIVFKNGDKFLQEAWTSPITKTLTPAKAFKEFLKNIEIRFDQKQGLYHKSNVSELEQVSIPFDAFMPRQVVPQGYNDVFKHI